MTVPYAFSAATSAIPLSQLDDNFNTPITLGNTAIQLGNTVTTLNNMSLANVTISSGNVTITNVTVTTANATTVNTTTLIATTANVTTINATDVNVATNVTLNAGTVNGVAYLNGSKVLTTGSALTFDGTTLGVNSGSSTPALKLYGAAVSQGQLQFSSTSGYVIQGGPDYTGLVYNVGSASYQHIWQINGSEKMRLTSTTLYTASDVNVGIGTSSPSNKLVVSNAGAAGLEFAPGETNGPTIYSYNRSTSAWTALQTFASEQIFCTNGTTERMRLDASGNLGLGVTPSAWGSGQKAIQMQAGAIWNFNAFNMTITQNAFSDGTERYIGNGFASKYNQNSGAHAWSIAASGNAGDPITFTQAMTLDASGNLQLGNTSYAYRVAASRASDGIVGYFRRDGATVNPALTISCNETGNTVGFGTDYAGATSPAMTFSTQGTERARITSGGKFLVGQTALNINANNIAEFQGSCGIGLRSVGGAAFSGLQVWNDAASGDNLLVEFLTDAGGTLRGTIDYNRAGGQVRYNTTSDYRAKEVYGTVQDSGAQIDALKIYRGKMLGATQERPMMIAHEAQQVVPYAVGGEKDAVNEDGTPKYQTMDHQILVPLLIAELQSLRARVAQLESKGA